MSTEATERRVLIPIDHSTHSKRAVEWYLNNLFRKDDLIIFVHSVEPAHSGASMIATSGDELPAAFDALCKVSSSAIQDGKYLCQDYSQLVEDKKLRTRKLIYVDPKPGRGILKAIHELKPHMVVMGNRGMGKLRETFLGSVSAYVLHHAEIPVCIVPPSLHKNS